MKKNFIIPLVAAVMIISTFAAITGSSSMTKSGANPPSAVTALPSAYAGSVTIDSNGTVSPAGVLSQSGNTYTLTENISGTLTDYSSNITILGAGYTIDGLGGTGIYFYSVSNVQVSNLVINDSYTGVDFEYVNNVVASNLSIQSIYEYAFYVDYSGNVSILSNIIDYTYYGIYAQYSNSIIIASNVATNLSYTFAYLYFCDNQAVSQNDVTFLLYYVDYGIDSEYTSGGQINGNTFTNAYYGIYLTSATDIHLSYNTVQTTYGYYGFEVVYSSYIYSSHDVVSQFPAWAFYANSVEYLNVQYDNFNNASYGSSISYVYQANISHTDFSNTTYSYEYGLEVYYSGAVNLSYDNFNESYAYGTYTLDIYDQYSPVTLFHDTIYSPSGYGLYLYSVANLYVNDSVINAYDGVYTYSSTLTTVFSHDTFISQYYGTDIYFSGSFNSNLILSDNQFVSSPYIYAYGVAIYSAISNNIKITGNSFANLSYAVQLDVSGGQNLSLTDNLFLNDSNPITVVGGAGVTISGNTLLNVSSMGILVNGASGSNISWNSVSLLPGTYYVTGIELEYALGSSIVYHNTITGGSIYYDDGIYLYSTMMAQVFDNSVASTYYSLTISYTQNSSIFDNTVTSGSYGIDSSNNQGFTYFDNRVVNSAYSFYSYNDNIGQIHGNSFVNATADILYIWYSGHLTFYHNNFMDGTSVPTYIYGLSGVNWNLSLPTGGNYWSNYTGTGTNGIGTTPYIINGANVDYLPLTSRWATSTVTFVETGLPAGTSWSVSFGQSSITSSTTTIVFEQTNGMQMSQSYVIPSVPGFRTSSGSGSVFLNGTDKIITLSFSPYSYQVAFVEKGLQAGASWTVTLGSSTKTSTSSTITFTETNGTYAYTVGGVQGYQTPSSTGKTTVNGVTDTVSVDFTQITYVLTIDEVGLPSGSSWTVSVDGVNHTSTAPTMTLSLTTGNYTILITGPSGYTLSVPSSNITIDYSNTTFAVQFAHQSGSTQSPGSSPTTMLGSSLYEGLVIGAIFGAVLVALIATLVTRSSKKKGKQGQQ